MTHLLISFKNLGGFFKPPLYFTLHNTFTVFYIKIGNVFYKTYVNQMKTFERGLKMNKISKLGILVMTVFMMLGVFNVETGHAIGKNNLPPAPTEGTPSKNLKKGKGEVADLSTQSSQYLANGDCYINSTGTAITVGGKTSAYSSVDTVAVDIYLQRWNSSTGQWGDIAHAGEFKDYNTSLAVGSNDTSVPGGYYYRTRAHHWVNEGGVIEQSNSVSTYIYVN